MTRNETNESKILPQQISWANMQGLAGGNILIVQIQNSNGIYSCLLKNYFGFSMQLE